MNPVHPACNQSSLDCLETVAGVIQVGTQWVLFSVMCVISTLHDYLRANDPFSLVLYILYFPPHLKYVTLDIEGDELRPSERVKTNLKSDTWRLSIILSWIVIIHLSVFILPVQNWAVTHSRVCESQNLLYLCNFYTAAVFAHRPLGCCSIAA
jgi:hypothetical protein